MKKLIIMLTTAACAFGQSKKPPKTMEEHKDSVNLEVRKELESKDSAMTHERDSIKADHQEMKDALEARKDSLRQELLKEQQ